MKTNSCRQESQILAEVRSSSLSRTSREHLATCDACSQTMQVERLLSADAHQVPSLADLPDPTLIWWRSRQLARIRQTERATLPIQLAERLAMVLGAVGLIVGLSLTWPMLRATLDQWVGGWAKGFSAALPLQGSSLILAVSCSLFVLVGFGLYTQSAEK